MSESDKAVLYAQVDQEQREVALKRGPFGFKPTTALFVFFAVLLLTLPWYYKRTIVFEERLSSGVEIFHSPLPERTTLAIWSPGSNSHYNISGTAFVKRVVNKNWLAHDSAIHLVLEIGYVESSHPVSTTAQIIYDFRRAELDTLCDLPLWRPYNLKGGAIDKGWMTSKEFESILSRLQKT